MFFKAAEVHFQVMFNHVQTFINVGLQIHETLYPVLKQAKREQKRAFFNFDKLIINGQIYRGEETKNLPYYGNIMKNFV